MWNRKNLKLLHEKKFSLEMDEIENSVKKPLRPVMSKHDFRLRCIILSERPTLRYKYNESHHIDKNRPETAKSPNSTLTCYE